MALTITLLRREWMQHRLAWMLLATVPTVLSLLLLSFGHIEFAEDGSGESSPPVPVVLALATVGGSMAVHAVLLIITALIIVSGLTRRDHGDRSVEFWLSLPVGPARSLAIPLLTHLLLAPMAAALVGFVGGMLMSVVLLARTEGLATWAGLPWGSMLGALLACGLRGALGLLLALVWISPLIVGVLLLTAWFKRWGLVIGALMVGVAPAVLDGVFAIHGPARVLMGWLEGAAKVIFNTGQSEHVVVKTEELLAILQHIPRWAVDDAWHAIQLTFSPLAGLGVVMAALGFAGLVWWRRQGAGT